MLGQILKIVNKCEGDLLLKEYVTTLTTQNLFINREILLYILEHGDFANLVPSLIETPENKLHLANFIKITFNES